MINPGMAGPKHYRIRVQGRVQGVGFRYATHEKATRLGLKGYVRNLDDGSVLIEAEGDPGLLDELVAWCHRGPGWARVDQLDLEELPPEDFQAFRIR